MSSPQQHTNLALYINENRDKDYAVTQQVLAILKEKKCQVFLEEKDFTALQKQGHNLEHVLCPPQKDVKLHLVLGGDGTLLRACHRIPLEAAHLVGLNLGGLGFMAEISVETLEKDIQRLLDGDYDLQDRMLLHFQHKREGKLLAEGYALNDLVFHRQCGAHLSNYALFLNQKAIELLSGDGLIVSSPTGSTAYAMAAGGPILSPEMEALQMTPICPHSLQNRPYLFPAHNVLSVLCLSDQPSEAFSVDGQKSYSLEKDDCVEITKASQKLHLIQLREENFFQSLHIKMKRRVERQKDLHEKILSIEQQWRETHAKTIGD